MATIRVADEQNFQKVYKLISEGDFGAQGFVLQNGMIAYGGNVFVRASAAPDIDKSARAPKASLQNRFHCLYADRRANVADEDQANAKWNALVSDLVTEFYRNYSVLTYAPQGDDEASLEQLVRLRKFLTSMGAGGDTLSIKSCPPSAERVAKVAVKLTFGLGTMSTVSTVVPFYFREVRSGERTNVARYEILKASQARAIAQKESEIRRYGSTSGHDEQLDERERKFIVGQIERKLGEVLTPDDQADLLDVIMLDGLEPQLCDFIDNRLCGRADEVEQILASTGASGQLRDALAELSADQLAGILRDQLPDEVISVSDPKLRYIAILSYKSQRVLCSRNGVAHYDVHFDASGSFGVKCAKCGRDILSSAQVDSLLVMPMTDAQLTDSSINPFLRHAIRPRCGHKYCTRIVCVADFFDGTDYCVNCPYEEVMVVIDDSPIPISSGQLVFCRDTLQLELAENSGECACCGRTYTRRHLNSSQMCAFCAALKDSESTEIEKTLYQRYRRMLPCSLRKSDGVCVEDHEFIIFFVGGQTYIYDKRKNTTKGKRTLTTKNE